MIPTRLTPRAKPIHRSSGAAKTMAGRLTVDVISYEGPDGSLFLNAEASV